MTIGFFDLLENVLKESRIILSILGFFFIMLISRLSKRRYNPSRRKKYYREVFLKSKKWYDQRTRVFKRDNYRCVKCYARATEVHHKRYAKKIGNEPDSWLISICRNCHEREHSKKLF